jgi:glycosyltransferase involved in cell wall biosynthesis
MNQGHPRVTVGVPVFNGERFLVEALESLLNQTFSDLEIVISDNASTDQTEEICRAHAARDPRVRYYRNDVNRGAAWNHNRVFELARGEFFKWNSADDFCAPEFLNHCVAALDQDPDAVMAVTQSVEVDEVGNPLASAADQTLLPVVPLGAPAHVRFRHNIHPDHWCVSIYSLIRSDILRQTDLIGNYADSDRVLLAHLALFGDCIVVPETMLFNRDHPDRFVRRHNGYYDGWRERATWFDPSNAKRKVFPFWKELLELWRVVPQTPLKWQDQLRCYWEIVRRLGHKGHLRYLYINATYYPRKWMARHFPRTKAAWNWLWSRG